jgi:hypothetical protein
MFPIIKEDLVAKIVFLARGNNIVIVTYYPKILELKICCRIIYELRFH